MSLLEIFQKLNTLTSTKDKEALLLVNKANKELQELLEANLNTYKLFQFNKMPEYVMARPPFQENGHKAFLELLNRLQNRTVTRNEAKKEISSFFHHLYASTAELYSKILLKQPIGVGASTVNKIWPDLVPTFELMLAPNELPVITNIKYPTYIQPKLDGYRCIYYNGSMWSRTGKPFGNKNLTTFFNKVHDIQDYVLDGELYSKGTNFNKLQKILNSYDEPLPNSLKYVVYDAVPKADWEAQNCKKPYSDRIKLFRRLLNDTIADYSKVIDISNDLVQDAKEAIDIYKEHLQKGYEGSMIKDPEGLYQWKRTTVKSGEMLKLKPFKSVDLVVKEIYDGEGDFQGMAGGVVVDFGGVAVRCGSGFNVAMRKEMASKSSNFIGKVAEIKYFEETPEGSLRFPIFKRWREDKE